MAGAGCGAGCVGGRALAMGGLLRLCARRQAQLRGGGQEGVARLQAVITTLQRHPTSPNCIRTRQPTRPPARQVTELFSGYVGAMLAEYGASPAAAWKAKDTACYLVTALAVRGKTAAAGATATNALVNLQDFYAQQIAPELGTADVNERPILKADALKFVTTFRSQLPKDAELALFPALIKCARAAGRRGGRRPAGCAQAAERLRGGCLLRPLPALGSWRPAAAAPQHPPACAYPPAPPLLLLLTPLHLLACPAACWAPSPTWCTRTPPSPWTACCPCASRAPAAPPLAACALRPQSWRPTCSRCWRSCLRPSSCRRAGRTSTSCAPSCASSRLWVRERWAAVGGHVAVAPGLSEGPGCLLLLGARPCACHRLPCATPLRPPPPAARPAGPTIAPVAPACLQQLSAQLLAVCKNPTQPGFNHYLFESVAALVRRAVRAAPLHAAAAAAAAAALGLRATSRHLCPHPTPTIPPHPTHPPPPRYGCEADPGAVGAYEAQLFPPFQVVLQEDVQEFSPYVFQIFAQVRDGAGDGRMG